MAIEVGEGEWIGVDLDGTLAEYHGWVQWNHIGEPIPAMLDRVKVWTEQGHEVRIMTARAKVGDGSPGASERCRITGQWFTQADMVDVISNWCIKHVGCPLVVTNEKDYRMAVLFDDRAISVEANTGRVVGFKLAA